ncbi:MAG: hypothetical protein AVDCRST_MAG66-3513, partial [uncultured Pseudonocardia sp.]
WRALVGGHALHGPLAQPDHGPGRPPSGRARGSPRRSTGYAGVCSSPTDTEELLD